MSSIGERIELVFKQANAKKIQAAKRLSLSPAFISEICSGKKLPSDRTILDICREFGVNEIWLREGVGEMFHEPSRGEEISAFMGDILKAGDAEFRSQLISVLTELSVDEWAVLQKLATKLAQESKKETEQ